MRKFFIIIFTYLLTAPVFSQDLLDRIVAIVDDNIILQSELMQYTRQYAMQSGIDLRSNPNQIGELQQQVLRELITSKILLVKAKEDSIEIDAKQVSAALDDQINNMIQQVGSQENLEKEFGFSMRIIRKRFREQIEENALVSSLKQKKLSEIRISRREVNQFYETMRDSLPDVPPSANLSHVLLSVKAGGAAREIALKKIEDIQKELQAGGDFAELARQYSEDPGSKTRGGDLGFTQRGEFVKPYEEAAFSLEIGQVSGIVESQFGFHIIELIDRRGEKVHTRHILIQLPVSTNDEARTIAKLDSIRDDIVSGNVSFTDAAKEYSEDPQSSPTGGNLGWFEIEQISVPRFQQLARELKPGELSKPFKGPTGYHIVRLNERKDARKISPKDDYDTLHMWALNRKQTQIFSAWIEKLRSELFIKIND
ncbi:MAG: hypothetical protein DWQ05_03585 [Calditrichaeota bacterium]|nr:MAG: hypothetical protein DWQ05_03585 [Calditrichota bacterium]